MRNYWLRIVLGAVGIFAAGMLVWTAIRRGRDRVVEVVQSDRPITIPLAFVPFSLDGHPVGTLSKVEIVRSSPEDVSAVNFAVKLADSVPDQRLEQCVLLARENLDHINPGKAFRCAQPADTVGKALEPVGQVETQRGGVYVLLGPAGALRQFKFDVGHGESDDSIAASVEAMADSIERRADSISASADSLMQAADSIRSAALHQADSARRAALTLRDSIRRQVREQVRRSLQDVPTPPPAR
jgi:hypothetical protein